MRNLSPDRREVTATFGRGDERIMEEAASVLGDRLRELGWGDADQIEAAVEVVRNAGSDLLGFMAHFPEPADILPDTKSDGTLHFYRVTRPGKRSEALTVQDMVEPPEARLTVRISNDSDIRALHVSVECHQYRPLGPVRHEETARRLAGIAQHSRAAVGAEVFESLKAATRAGVEQNGEVWASFEEPRAANEAVRDLIAGPPTESTDPKVLHFAAKRRVVEKLYDDHHIRLIGWEAPDVRLDSLVSADRTLRDLVAEYGGKKNLREVRFVDQSELIGFDSKVSTARAYSCGTVFGGKYRNNYSGILIDRRAVCDPNWSAKLLKDSQSTKWWGRRPGDLVSYLLHHEFVHVVDFYDRITELDHTMGTKLKAAFEVYRKLGFMWPNNRFIDWSGLLPLYVYHDGDPADGANAWKEMEVLAEGSVAGSSDTSLPLTDPARVTHVLSHGLDEVEFANTMADWADAHEINWARMRDAGANRGLLHRLFAKVRGPVPATEGEREYLRPVGRWPHEDNQCGPLTMEDIGSVTGRDGLGEFTAGLGGCSSVASKR